MDPSQKVIPPPPPGFQMMPEASAIPPPPPGFKLVQPPAQPQISQPTPAKDPNQDSGWLSKAWDWANRGIIKPETFQRYIGGYSPEELEAMTVDRPEDSPTMAGFKAFVRGASKDASETASSFTSPASIALIGAGNAAKALPAASKLATGLKVASGAAGVGFGVKGAEDLREASPELHYEGITERPETLGFGAKPDEIHKALQGGAMAAGGAAGALEMAPTAARVAASAAKGAGRVAGAAAVAGANKASSAFRNVAEANIERVLGATTKKLKAIASDKLVPEILDRGITANTREGLSEKAAEGVAKYGKEIDDAIQRHTQTGVEIQTQPLIDQLEDLKSHPSYSLKSKKTGATTATRDAAINQIQEVQDTIAKYGQSITPEDLVGVRRFLDDAVAKKKMAFLADDSKGFEAQAQEAASNVLRKIINTEFPDVAEANKEFSFYKNLETVVDATIQRKASQRGDVPELLKVARGGGVGASLGTMLGGPAGGIAGGVAGRVAEAIHDSVGYRTRAAKVENKLADVLDQSNQPVQQTAAAQPSLKVYPQRAAQPGAQPSAAQPAAMPPQRNPPAQPAPVPTVAPPPYPGTASPVVQQPVAAAPQAAMSPTPNRAAFQQAYEKTLNKLVEDNPEEYRYDKSKVPAVAARIVDSVANGKSSAVTEAMKMTAKELGIPQTSKAIQEFVSSPEPKVTPDRKLIIGRGAHGQVTVVFPDKAHADLFSAIGRSRRQFSGNKPAIDPGWKGLGEKLGLSGVDLHKAASEYRELVMEAVKNLPEGEIWGAPEHVGEAADIIRMRNAEGRGAEDAASVAKQEKLDALNREKYGNDPSQVPGFTRKALGDPWRSERGRLRVMENRNASTMVSSSTATAKETGATPQESAVTPAPKGQPVAQNAIDNIQAESGQSGRGQSVPTGTVEGATGEVQPIPRPNEPSARTKASLAETKISVPGELEEYPARYALRELDDILTSHSGLNFQANEKYALKNDRDYSNKVNQGKIVNGSQAGKFDPRYHITDNPDATNGPLVVDEGGHVLGGNGRGMILERVYKYNPEGAAAYRDLLEKRAEQFGIDPKELASMKQPVLVREIPDDYWNESSSKASAITNLNKVGTAALTPGERAIADSRRVSQKTLDHLASELDSQGQDATMNDALQGSGGLSVLNNLIDDGVVSPQERAAFADRNGLTTAGKERIAKLILGRFFRDPAQLERIDAATRNKVEKLAAPLAKAEAVEGWALTGVVQEAMDLIEEMRSHGITNVNDLLRQQNLFGGSGMYSPESVVLAEALRASKPIDLLRAARQYAEDASFASHPSLFGEAPTPGKSFEESFSPLVRDLAVYKMTPTEAKEFEKGEPLAGARGYGHPLPRLRQRSLFESSSPSPKQTALDIPGMEDALKDAGRIEKERQSQLALREREDQVHQRLKDNAKKAADLFGHDDLKLFDDAVEEYNRQPDYDAPESAWKSYDEREHIGPEEKADLLEVAIKSHASAEESGKPHPGNSLLVVAQQLLEDSEGAATTEHVPAPEPKINLRHPNWDASKREWDVYAEQFPGFTNTLNIYDEARSAAGLPRNNPPWLKLEKTRGKVVQASAPSWFHSTATSGATGVTSMKGPSWHTSDPAYIANTMGDGGEVLRTAFKGRKIISMPDGDLAYKDALGELRKAFPDITQEEVDTIIGPDDFDHNNFIRRMTENVDREAGEQVLAKVAKRHHVDAIHFKEFTGGPNTRDNAAQRSDVYFVPDPHHIAVVSNTTIRGGS